MIEATLTMVSQIQQSFRCRALVEEGLRVRVAHIADIECYHTLCEHPGFGHIRAGRLSPPANTPAEPPVERRMNHFFFPFPGDENEQKLATLEGVITPQQVEETENAVALILKARGAGATEIIWRVTPEWASSRCFETMTTEHVLYARGTFIW